MTLVSRDLSLLLIPTPWGPHTPCISLWFILSPSPLSRRPSLSLLSLTRVRPHVALEIEGIVEALAAAVAHVAPCWAVALEVPSQHALQREGLGAKRAAKCPWGPGSRGQGSL